MQMLSCLLQVLDTKLSCMNSFGLGVCVYVFIVHKKISKKVRIIMKHSVTASCKHRTTKNVHIGISHIELCKDAR
jgi:hypothetical protein